jgi:hypothetical protein
MRNEASGRARLSNMLEAGAATLFVAYLLVVGLLISSGWFGWEVPGLGSGYLDVGQRMLRPLLLLGLAVYISSIMVGPQPGAQMMEHARLTLALGLWYLVLLVAAGLGLLAWWLFT